MDAKEAREELLRMRKRFDEGAKKIVEGLNADENREDVESRIADARSEKAQELTGMIESDLMDPFHRTVAAFEQWEIMERVPLNEDESFMYAFRDLTHALEAFDPFKTDARK